MKKNVNGIILVLSCYKYKEIRKQFRLKNNKYLNWEVIYVFGDLNLKSDYILNDNTLLLKTEDTYLHIIKKLILSLKILKENFNIKEGILRCGDDLIFNDKHLLDFLKLQNKEDYMGKNFDKKDILEIKNIYPENQAFMINYYNRHFEDKNELNAILKEDNLNINKLNVIPNISNFVALGHIYYLSNKSIDIIIKYFFEIYNQNVCYFEKNYFPLIHEDVGVGYILFNNNIKICGLIHIIRILIII